MFCSRTISAITAMVRTNMAAMAHVFLAHRVRSIHIEKDTNLLGNICKKCHSDNVIHYTSCHFLYCVTHLLLHISVAFEQTFLRFQHSKKNDTSQCHGALFLSFISASVFENVAKDLGLKTSESADQRHCSMNSVSHHHRHGYQFCFLTLGKVAAREHTVRMSNSTSPTARVT